jgi:hypothetical protein
MENANRKQRAPGEAPPIPDEVRAPLVPKAKESLAQIEKRLPAWKRRSILRAALAIGLRAIDQAPADAIKEFGR